jgi:hypothetical protein
VRINVGRFSNAPVYIHGAGAALCSSGMEPSG